MELIEYLMLIEEYKPQISEFIKNCIRNDVVIEYKREIINNKITYFITIENYDVVNDDKNSIIHNFIDKLKKLGFKACDFDTNYLKLNYTYEQLSVIDEILKKEKGVDVRKLNMEHDDIMKFCRIFIDFLTKNDYGFKEEEHLNIIRLY